MWFKECGDIYLFAKFYIIICLTRMLKRWRTAKIPVFGQDVFDTHGFDCTRQNLRIFFFIIMINLVRHWFRRRASKTYNDIGFCKEAKWSYFKNYTRGDFSSFKIGVKGLHLVSVCVYVYACVQRLCARLCVRLCKYLGKNTHIIH